MSVLGCRGSAVVSSLRLGVMVLALVGVSCSGDKPEAKRTGQALDCSCSGTGLYGAITIDCDTLACGQDYHMWLCSSSGWSQTSATCGDDMNTAPDLSGCSCSGTGLYGAITIDCDSLACGQDYHEWLCSSSGWSQTSATCGDDMATSSCCTCTGDAINGPITVECGQEACGQDYNIYSCTSSGWVNTSAACVADFGVPDLPPCSDMSAPPDMAREDGLIAKVRGALTPSPSGRLRPAPSSIGSSPAMVVSSPTAANGTLHLTEPVSGVEIGLQRTFGTSSTVVVDQHYSEYFDGAGTGFDILQRVDDQGVEDFYTFDTEPTTASLAYALTLENNVAGLRLVGGVLEVLDSDGKPRLRMRRPILWTQSGAVVPLSVAVGSCSYDTDPRAPWGRSVTAPGATSCTLTISWSVSSGDYPLVIDPSWGTGASTACGARQHSSVTTMPNGHVLFAGGDDAVATSTDCTELFKEGLFAVTGSMNNKHSQHTASLVEISGVPKVIVIGGAPSYDSVESYDPSAGTWTNKASLSYGRASHTSTVLPDGRVLVSGGRYAASYLVGTSELYNPSTNGWTTTAALSTARQLHSASLIEIAPGQQRVLVAGGCTGLTHTSGSVTATTELFDPAGNSGTGAWTAGPSMNDPRDQHGVAVLDDGRVIVAGGLSWPTATPALAPGGEVLDPEALTWTRTAALTNKTYATAGLVLPNGLFALLGGHGDATTTLAGAQVYDDVADTWSTVAGSATPQAREAFDAVNVVVGGIEQTLLAAGYEASSGVLDSAQLFQLGQRDGSCTAHGECQSGQCVGPSGSRTCGPRSCSSASDCGTGWSCGGSGTCVAKLPNGTAASSSSLCGSGVLSSTEGICCDTACSGECDRCDTAGHVGQCQLLPAGTSCTGHKVCSGSSSACPSTCSTDSQCEAAYHCASGSCVARTATGSGCSGDSDCVSGFCVGGTCCSSSCDTYGSCSTCSTGTCALSGASGCQAGAEPTVDNPSNTVPTAVYDAIRALWDGSTPVQGTQIGSTATVTALSSSIFDPNRVSVLHGKVLSGAGMPLSGIRVRALPKDNGDSATDYGVSFTRVDGSYDYVVNGGFSITLVFEENVTPSNFLMAERDVLTPPKRMVAVDDVKMVLKTGSSTSVTLGTGWQHVTGPTVGSGATARTPVVIFPGTTSATITPPGGSPSSTSSIHLRVTEFTDSADEQKMPGSLPSTSAFTYASDVALDEAGPLDQVTFSGGDPILYVDDFIGMGTGSTAPLGAYDNNQAIWAGAPSGKVVKLLGVSSSLMNVDVDGDGYADGDVNGDSVTDSLDSSERAQLAAIYPSASNQPMWRVTLPHLSYWDVNWSIFPPSDATPWDGVPQSTQPVTDPNLSCGSIIDCQNQALGESVSVPGTPYALVYKSNRQPGHGSALRVPVTTGSMPSDVTGATVQVSVAGRWVSQYYNATQLASAPVFTYQWDGKDALGQRVFGTVQASVRVGWEYAPVYAATDAFGHNGGLAITFADTRTALIYWSPWRSTTLENWDFAHGALGGWSLDVHHVYDPKEEMLLLGDGTLLAQHDWAVENVIGNNSRDCGQTGVANEIGIDEVDSFAVHPLGRIYFIEVGNCGRRLAYRDLDGSVYNVGNTTLADPMRVVVSPDGKTYVLNKHAGTSHIYRLSWDHSTATDIAPGVSLSGAEADIAAAPDGSVYFIDPNSDGIIRRIMPSGDVETVLGSGAATSARAGYAWFTSMAVTSDGTLYYVSNGQVFALGQGGTPYGVMGTFTGTYGDGMVATELAISALNHIAVAPDGTIYVTEGLGYSQRIWRIDPDRRARIVAGHTPSSPWPLEQAADGSFGVGTTANMVMAIAVGPDSSLYLADYDQQNFYVTPGGTILAPRNKPLIRALRRHLAKEDYTLTPDVVYRVPSRDGTEVYDFSRLGQHLQTVSAKTGQILRSFDYDSDGNLTGVTEHAVGSGVTQATTITYGSGSIDITGPYGHDTQLTLDSGSNCATQILMPSGSGYAYSYDANCLMTSYTDPRGNVHRFQYDSIGRLLRDDNPVGGNKSLAVTQTDTSTTTTITTKEGMVTTHVVDTGTSLESRANTDPAGLTSTWVQQSGGINHQTNADGSTVDWTEGVDPRFNRWAPITASYQQSLQVTSGVPLTYSTTMTRTATCVASACGSTAPCDTSHLALLGAQTDTVVVNGETYTVAYDNCGAGTVPTITTTTPESRTRTTTLDEFGRVTSVSVPGIEAVTISYDSHGRVDTVSQGSGGLQRTLTNAYYSSGTGEKGQLHTSSVNLPTTMTTTYASYDDDTRPLSVTLPGTSRTLGLSYDASGNLVSLDPPGSTATAHGFALDENDRLKAYNPPAISSVSMPTQYRYDRDGRVVALSRPDGDDVFYTYDTGGRLTGARHALRSLSWAYDTVGRVANVMSSDGELLQYGYTATGALVLSEKWKGEVGGSSGNEVDWTYDSNFRVATETAGGLRAEYTYDGDGLITEVDVKDASSGTLLTNGAMTLGHDPSSNLNGLLTDVVVGTLTDTRTYNTFGELASFSDGANVAYVLDASGHERDQLGRITRRAETYPTTRTLDYAYDTAGRLSTVSNGGSTVESYSYDANGNRTGWTNGSGTWTCSTVDAQDRLGTCTDGTNTLTFTYNRNGDRLTRTRTSQPTQTYTYDAFGNLLSVVPSSGSRIDYVIDGQGRRVGKKVAGTLARQWVWGSQLRPVAELDGSGTVLARFVYATHVNVPDLIVKSGTVYRVLTDHLGSVRAIVNAGSGAVAQTFDYDSYGNIISASPALGYSGQEGLQTFGFAGGLYDGDTKLVRFGARDYDSEIGRWLAKDPLRFDGGDSNVYSRVGGDPMTFVDPNGKLRVGSGITGDAAAAIRTIGQRISGEELSSLGRHGNTTTSDVDSALDPKKGPKVSGQKIASNRCGQYTNGTGTLTISQDVVDNFNNGLISQRQFDATVLHELTHYFNDQHGKHELSCGEEGLAFEVGAYGKVIDCDP